MDFAEAETPELAANAYVKARERERYGQKQPVHGDVICVYDYGREEVERFRFVQRIEPEGT